MLKGKKIILGLTGSIAAYKSASLARLLVREGAELRVVMTPYSKEFITPLTLSTLSGHPVYCEFFDKKDGEWNSHVDLGIWADIMLIAPATANTMGKMATGIADNLLVTTYLSARCPVVIAPAMDMDMFNHPTTKNNINILKGFGNHIIEPAVGELASGLEVKGRMEEPENILAWLKDFFKKKSRFQTKKVLITAGPTLEQIDPVRFIGNYSSGKMGIALANAFLAEGAEVHLIAGPIDTHTLDKRVRLTNIVSAIEMHEACVKLFPDMDIAIMNAAVSDFRPAGRAESKIKRSSGGLSLDLVPNPDIAAELGGIKKEKQLLVGFALETDEGLEEAYQKKERKNLDMIVLNSLKDAGSGFGGDTNRISIISRNNKAQKFELKTKKEVAEDIIEAIFKIFED